MRPFEARRGYEWGCLSLPGGLRVNVVIANIALVIDNSISFS